MGIRACLAFRAYRHSSSNQGFDFLGMVVALGMQSFGHFHGYPAAPPTHFSEQVLVWKL